MRIIPTFPPFPGFGSAAPATSVETSLLTLHGPARVVRPGNVRFWIFAPVTGGLAAIHGFARCLLLRIWCSGWGFGLVDFDDCTPEVGLDMARGGDGVAVVMGAPDCFGFVLRIEVGQTTDDIQGT
ncbi:hypothetical protein N7444_006321 [Penicillium canescens]|nr:hypothetical protein N7444_006321 [Penicillium canescens]